jgi:hypothetical protein
MIYCVSREVDSRRRSVVVQNVGESRPVTFVYSAWCTLGFALAILDSRDSVVCQRSSGVGRVWSCVPRRMFRVVQSVLAHAKRRPLGGGIASVRNGCVRGRSKVSGGRCSRVPNGPPVGFAAVSVKRAKQEDLLGRLVGFALS